MKGGDRTVWNTKDSKPNMTPPVSSRHQNMRVQSPGHKFNTMYLTCQLFVKHQLWPITTHLSVTEAEYGRVRSADSAFKRMRSIYMEQSIG